jgi:hypothetical protein
MGIDTFIQTWNGKKLEVFDSSSPNQCTDLVLGYIRDVLGLGHLIPIGISIAYDLWTKTHKLSPYVDKIPNTLTAIPQKGDIIVWKTTYGPAGHTAVCTGWAGQTQFETFSQNDPLGMGCVVKRYSYDHVAGWLRPKSLPAENMEISKEKFEELVMKATEADALFKHFNVQIGAKKSEEIIARVGDREKIISTQQEKLLNQGEELRKLSEQVKELTEKVADKERLREKWYNAYNEASQSKEFYMAQVTRLQEQIKKADLTQYSTKQLLKAVVQRLADKYLA